MPEKAVGEPGWEPVGRNNHDHCRWEEMSGGVALPFLLSYLSAPGRVGTPGELLSESSVNSLRG